MAKRVLIADDEPNIVVSLEFLMERHGYQIQVATTGDEVIPAVRSFQPDLVLLDVMLPGKTGFEICQELRQDASYRDLKIIMLTAKGRDTEVTKGLALGADAYITKPFSTKDLLAKVRELLGEAA
ncbi:MAG: response regulator transcription factor [Pseudomonadota bacterium]